MRKFGCVRYQEYIILFTLVLAMCKFDYALLCAIVNFMHLDWSVFIYIHFTCTDFNLVTIMSLLFWKLLIQMHAFIAILAVIGRRWIVIHLTVSGRNLTTGRIVQLP